MATSPTDPQSITDNNRGVGLMGKYEYEQAGTIFQNLVDQHPTWNDVRVNLAIATLNRQREGDEDVALAILDSVLANDPNDLRAHYCSGLLRLYLQSPQNAIEQFQIVATADPQDAYAAYYVGQCLSQLRQYEEAIEWYEMAIANDDYLRSAYYAAAQSYRALGRHDEAQRMLEQFQALERNPRARLVEFKYKRMGPKGEALAVNIAGDEHPALLPKPDGPIFADPVPLLTNGDNFAWTVRRDDRPVSITACDINGNGHIDVFIANVLDDENLFNAVCINNGDNTFTLDQDHILATIPDVNAALWGDYDNDGLTDVYLCRRGPNMLWQQAQQNVWHDVTASTNTANGEFDTVDGALFDADHDGDLDIFCVNFDGPNELLNNNLDGTFQPIAQEQGIAGDRRGSIQVLPVDLDRDRDVDIIVINREPPHDVWMNDRMWRYQRDAHHPLVNQVIDALVAADLNTDGEVELYMMSGSTLQRWVERDPPLVSPGRIVPLISWKPDLSPTDRMQLAIADMQGDNNPSVLGQFRGQEMRDQQWSMQSVPQSALSTPLILDSGRGPSLVGLSADSAPMIWHPGRGRYGYSSAMFTGRKDADTMRSNASGIGTHFTARIGSMWVTDNTLKNSSTPGQSLQPVAIGLGGHPQIDFLSVDWSDGVFQSEIDLEAGKHHIITETQRQLSSCPVLFAWNRTKYEFISDVLGVGGMGYMVAPGEYAQPRPWENFMLPPGSLQPKDGHYVLKLGEPMEEACYLDAARLVAYDLPPGWKMTLDERMNIAGPEPTGEPRFYREEVLPIAATNDRGEDVLQSIASNDLRAAPVGELDHRFIGRLKNDHVLTLTFDRAINGEVDSALSGKPLLMIDGWVEYPYSQTMFAAWQAKADYRAPTIEAMGDDGEWHIVLEQFGYPAGMPRQMSVPLENLPPHTTRLRITTNQEIYWDRIAIAFAEPTPAHVVRRELKLNEARLIQSGFAKRTTRDQRQPYYDYDRRSPYWDTRYQRGEYTRIGEMTDLVRDVDDAVAVFGPGEEIHMEFAAELPAIPYTLQASSETSTIGGRWSRVFVLELNGWCKDMDLFTRDGETIEPLPVTAGSDAATNDRRKQLHQQFNTRYESGR